MKLLTYFFLSFFLSLGCNNREITENDIIHLENKREIFVDHYLIDKLVNASIRLHHPNDEGIVMYFDKPWEGQFSGYGTILKDENVFRAYYRGWTRIEDTQVTCYAESKDGIHWSKPELGLIEIDGSTDNNVVLDFEPVTHNFSPFVDNNPKASPEQKFKALGGNRKTGLFPYGSPDGIKWKAIKNEGVVTGGAFDSQNVVFWSESEKLYVCYFRIFTEKRVRSICRTTSVDFLNWSEPVEMIYGDTPFEHLYTQQTSPYFRAPHIYLAIGARFFPDRQILSEEQLKQLNVDPTQYKGLSEAFIMTTRGGNVYDRTFMDAFIRPGIGLNNWSARTNYPALNVVQTSPEEMSIYVNQDYAQPTAHLHRYSLRLDGFTSINAPYKGGELITKPFTFSGNKLEINYSTSAAGEIRIEIQNKNGETIPGYTLSDSQEIIGNEISRIVSWDGKSDLQKLNSNAIRLRIYMKDADLYSIKFRD